MHTVSVRPANPNDAEVLASLIAELGKYEGLAHEARPNPVLLQKQLALDANPRLYALIVEVNGEAVGFAIYFLRYSTFLSNWGIHLEDLYIKEKFRGHGAGDAIFTALATTAYYNGYERLDLNVLDWNKTAIKFYEKRGGTHLGDWLAMRFEKSALENLAKKNPHLKV